MFDTCDGFREACGEVSDYLDVVGWPFPTNDQLEIYVRSKKLRGKITRDNFRVVCNKLRNRWTPDGVRISPVDKEVLQAAKKAGCKSVTYKDYEFGF